jgi:pyruvate dehydrogenase E1 component
LATTVPKSTRKKSAATVSPARLDALRALERKVLWLSSWMIHHANHVRPSRDGLKVGGHQASCASVVTVMTALYLDALRPEDRVAVKPHAAPVFHAIQYLLGHLDRAKLETLRGFGGLQPYPSRTKDPDDVDFSTGSVGLGAAMTVFASLTQDYVRLKKLGAERQGRMVALVGDAELDEGNMFEALLEGWKHELQNCWWIVDYNRQSLDAVVTDRLFGRIDHLFETMGWRVVTLKYGKKLEAAFKGPGGVSLREWIDACPNALYAALTFKGGAGWREHLKRDLDKSIAALLDEHDDASLGALMTNLGGHDMETVLDAFHAAQGPEPTCFIAYTVKGMGLPFAGHKDNHAGLMNLEQMEMFRRAMGVGEGTEWDRFAGLDMEPERLDAFLKSVPFSSEYPRKSEAASVAVPTALPDVRRERASTQEGFGRVLDAIAREGSALADRIVTVSPDVTVSTNLGPWVNRRGIFARTPRQDEFAAEHLVSAQRWALSPTGQHFELGIAENNLFLMLAALGLSAPFFGARLLPIGTVYDPFIRRGLDALHYACYQDARFMLVATPSGITLAPEGGAHQSLETPLITLAQPGLTAFEPAYVDELAVIMRWGFEHMEADEGGSVALRLSTRHLDQPKREIDDALKEDILAGAYWMAPPGEGCELVIAFSGAVAPEAIAAHAALREDLPSVGLLAITSVSLLHRDWSHIARLLSAAPDATLVAVTDAHPATLSWLGAVAGQPIMPLGVAKFGQGGDIPDLYKAYGIDADAIVDAAARACLRRLG